MAQPLVFHVVMEFLPVFYALKRRGLKRGMRVSFRWSRGALATKLVRSRGGWTVRVPAGVKFNQDNHRWHIVC